MSSDEDISLGHLLARPISSAAVDLDVRDVGKRRRKSSKQGLLGSQKKGRYTFDKLRGSPTEPESKSEGSESNTSGRSRSFNYLAFDSAQEQALERQRNATGLGIASAVQFIGGSMSLSIAFDVYLRYLVAGLLLLDGGARVLRDQPASPDSQLYEMVRSRIEVGTGLNVTLQCCSRCMQAYPHTSRAHPRCTVPHLVDAARCSPET
jgi:hypothetical protein